MAEPEQTPALHHGQMARCKSCPTKIVWVFTLGGKKAPFELDEKGHWIIELGTAKHVGPPPAQLELGAAPAPQQRRYTNHFATCPAASDWRGKK